MKLHEIRSLSRTRTKTHKVSVEPAGGIYGVFDVVVEYEVEPPSKTRHVPDDYTTTEHHPGSLTILSVTLAKDVYEQDDDGKDTDKKWDKGTDAEKLPGWDKSDDDYVYDKIVDYEQD